MKQNVTSRSWRAFDVWDDKVIMSRPKFCSIVSKVICGSCLFKTNKWWTIENSHCKKIPLGCNHVNTYQIK
jgi:hypothetical protein